MNKKLSFLFFTFLMHALAIPKECDVTLENTYRIFQDLNQAPASQDYEQALNALWVMGIESYFLPTWKKLFGKDRIPDLFSLPKESWGNRESVGESLLATLEQTKSAGTFCDRNNFLCSQSIPDLYSILELPRTASFNELRDRYKKKVVFLHPDKNPSAEAKELFIVLDSVFKAIQDPNQRQVYDEIIGLNLDSINKGEDLLKEWIQFLEGLQRLERNDPKRILLPVMMFFLNQDPQNLALWKGTNDSETRVGALKALIDGVNKIPQQENSNECPTTIWNPLLQYFSQFHLGMAKIKTDRDTQGVHERTYEDYVTQQNPQTTQQMLNFFFAQLDEATRFQLSQAKNMDPIALQQLTHRLKEAYKQFVCDPAITEKFVIASPTMTLKSLLADPELAPIHEELQQQGSETLANVLSQRLNSKQAADAMQQQKWISDAVDHYLSYVPYFGNQAKERTRVRQKAFGLLKEKLARGLQTKNSLPQNSFQLSDTDKSQLRQAIDQWEPFFFLQAYLQYNTDPLSGNVIEEKGFLEHDLEHDKKQEVAFRPIFAQFIYDLLTQGFGPLWQESFGSENVPISIQEVIAVLQEGVVQGKDLSTFPQILNQLAHKIRSLPRNSSISQEMFNLLEKFCQKLDQVGNFLTLTAIHIPQMLEKGISFIERSGPQKFIVVLRVICQEFPVASQEEFRLEAVWQNIQNALEGGAVEYGSETASTQERLDLEQVPSFVENVDAMAQPTGPVAMEVENSSGEIRNEKQLLQDILRGKVKEKAKVEAILTEIAARLGVTRELTPTMQDRKSFANTLLAKVLQSF